MTKIIKKKEKGVSRHWKNFLDKDYLGSHNLEIGEEMLVTIEKFEGEEMIESVTETEFNEKGKKVAKKIPKTVLYFKEEVPKMIMNITNGNTIASLYGSHPDKWIGKQIQIFATPVKAFGKEQDALRIRDFIPTIKVNTKEYAEQLNAAKTLEELKTVWSSFSVSVKNDSTLITLKEDLKSTLK